MLAALKESMPKEVSWIAPDGGLNIWVRLPSVVYSVPLLVAARERGVMFAPASHFMPGRKDAAAFRLSFSRSTEKQINNGIAVLGEVVQAALASPTKFGPLAAGFEDLF